jgi:hypothetical protein
LSLTDGQFLALRNLARKQAGEAVDFINIADAQVLTDQGFAERGRGGWVITVTGSALLAGNPEPASAPSPPSPIRPLFGV